MKHPITLRAALPLAYGLASCAVYTLVTACGSSSVHSASTGSKDGGGGQTASSSGGSDGLGGKSASGGKSGSSGSSNGGNGGVAGGPDAEAPPPHVLRACPKADGGGVGVWESTNPADITIPAPRCGSQPCFFGAAMVVLNPQDTSIVYVAYDHHGIRKSSDCGGSWTKINTGRNGAILDTGSSWSMAIDPIDPQIIYANNGYGSQQGVWKSTNGGVDWDQTTPDTSAVGMAAVSNFATRISMDPTNHRHLVISFHSGCTGAYAPGCLAETVDAGANWNLIKLPTGGGEASGVIVIDAKDWLYGITGSGLWLTQDAGVTWSQVANDGGVTYYRTSNGTYFLASGAGALKSTDLKNWSGGSGPGFSGIAGDGTLLYGGIRYCGGGTPCFFTSPETDGVKWTALATSPKNITQGGVTMVYDPDHHIMYSANETEGFWRVLLH